jgi:hypothetical protein
MRRELAKHGVIDFESDIPFEIVEKICDTENVKEIQLCGNRGEILHYPFINETIELIKNKNIKLTINTNGDKFDESWWYKLGQKMRDPSNRCIFALDGVGKIHEIYRNTNFNNVFKNMVSFIKGGGHPVWQMILFQHNEHQVDFIKNLSKELGCIETWIINSRKYNDIYKKPTTLFSKTKQEILEDSTNTKVECRFFLGKRVYVSVVGDVWPCCHTRCFYGMQPFAGRSQIYKIYQQEKDFLNLKNNSLDHIVENSQLFKHVFKISINTPILIIS